MSIKPILITEEEYDEASDNLLGWCTVCLEFTTYDCEPDARGYPCSQCETENAYGAEEAFLSGYIEIDS